MAQKERNNTQITVFSVFIGKIDTRHISEDIEINQRKARKPQGDKSHTETEI